MNKFNLILKHNLSIAYKRGIIMKKWLALLSFAGLIVFSIFFVVMHLKGNEKPKVVAVLEELNTDQSKIVKAGIEKGFEDFNVEGKVIAPNSQYPASKQVSMLKDVLRQNPDALLLTPTQASATIPVLKQYEKRGIPVLILNQDAEWENQTSFIGTDHLKLGKTAGELLSSTLQPGDLVAVISSKQISSVEKVWINEAKKALKEGGIEIITEQQGDHVKSVVSNILHSYPDIKGIFATTDDIALKTLNIIEEMELDIPIVGTYGSRGMLKAVEEERLSTTLTQNPHDMGYLSVEQALKAINGEHVEKRVDSGVDIVTKSNAKEKLDFYEKYVFN
jgi:ribose transport system substrate-binding protein